jgi:hypothetical protein
MPSTVWTHTGADRTDRPTLQKSVVPRDGHRERASRFRKNALSRPLVPPIQLFCLRGIGPPVPRIIARSPCSVGTRTGRDDRAGLDRPMHHFSQSSSWPHMPVRVPVLVRVRVLAPVLVPVLLLVLVLVRVLLQVLLLVLVLVPVLLLVPVLEPVLLSSEMGGCDCCLALVLMLECSTGVGSGLWVREGNRWSS